MSVSWDRRIDKGKRRFKVLNEFNTDAVLDKETGLVWERKPNKEAVPWPNARLMCAQKAVGGRGGWRLPTFNELSSLIDPAVMDPTLVRVPAGHPFIDVQPAGYWSATVFSGEPGFSLIVEFRFVPGSDAPIFVTDANTSGGLNRVWAVRGGSSGPDTY
jgi:hypothetical protein